MFYLYFLFFFRYFLGLVSWLPVLGSVWMGVHQRSMQDTSHNQKNNSQVNSCNSQQQSAGSTSANQNSEGATGSQRTTRKSLENNKTENNAQPPLQGEDTEEPEEVTFVIPPTKKNGKTKTGTILRKGDEVISFTFEDVVYKAGGM